MTRSALITGVTGFIGGKLAARLSSDGWVVHAVIRASSDVSAIPADVRTHRYDGGVASLTRIVADAKPDVVFHLASLYLAEHRPEQIDALIASNVTLPTQLGEAMIAAGCHRLINTGTAWQHFGTSGYNPVNLYAATKQACIDILRYYHEARSLSVVTLKLFDTYGAGDKRRKLVQLLVDAAMAGEPLGMSPGDQIVDLTHVDDVVGAFIVASERILAAPSPIDETFFVLGERQTVRELVDIVRRTLGRPFAVEFGARSYRSREVMNPVLVDETGQLPEWQRRFDLEGKLGDLLPQQ